MNKNKPRFSLGLFSIILISLSAMVASIFFLPVFTYLSGNIYSILFLLVPLSIVGVLLYLNKSKQKISLASNILAGIIFLFSLLMLDLKMILSLNANSIAYFYQIIILSFFYTSFYYVLFTIFRQDDKRKAFKKSFMSLLCIPTVLIILVVTDLLLTLFPKYSDLLFQIFTSIVTPLTAVFIVNYATNVYHVAYNYFQFSLSFIWTFCIVYLFLFSSDFQGPVSFSPGSFIPDAFWITMVLILVGFVFYVIQKKTKEKVLQNNKQGKK